MLRFVGALMATAGGQHSCHAYGSTASRDWQLLLNFLLLGMPDAALPDNLHGHRLDSKSEMTCNLPF